ncbi:peptide deformylase 2 [Geomonas silvestris]|uniref:Peptide deformylase n=1 Tax=Geomonas silvestris TaxID=2740184 RepID=A0A6V8MEM3_9BACT|nr:peptide deformylase [Geomonas silvestris]GFO58430.1 peptide deformylase 2 [Geomonas silvestris]
MPIIRQIAQLGQPVLRKVTRDIADPAHPEVQALIDDMLVTVDDAHGVGLAAPQVFESLSLFVIASQPNPRYPKAPDLPPFALVNPELVWASDEKEKGWEGCLSIPGLRGIVPRHRKIGVRYLTRSGELREEEFSNFTARIFQHEFDHLKGIVFLDRMESPQELVTEKEYIRIVSG